jgi:hypothetical protein
MVPSPFETIESFLKIFDSQGMFLTNLLPFLIKSIPLLLWTLFVPILLYRNAQGRELLIGLFDDNEGVTGLRASVLILLYHFMGLAIFLARMAPFYGNEGDLLTAVSDTNDNLPITRQHPYIVVAVCLLPLFFYGFFMAILQIRRSFAWWKIIATALPILLSLWMIRWVLQQDAPTNLTAGFWKIQGWLLLNFVGIGLLVYAFGYFNRGNSQHQPTSDDAKHATNESKKESNLIFWNYFIVGVGMCMQVPLTAATMKILDIQHHTATHVSQLSLYNGCYIAIVALAFGLMALLSIVRNPQHFSPTFVLIVICLFYLIVGDLVIAGIATLVIKKHYVLAIIATVVVLAKLGIILFRKSKLHHINTVPSTLSTANRVTLDEYWAAWWAQHIQPELDRGGSDPIPIYLMAVQGGGSRAGYWISSLLNELDIKHKGLFRQRLFALTSASGGSAGIGATLSLWRYLDEHQAIPADRKVLLQRKLADAMFDRNYLSNQFMQLFSLEIIKRFGRIFRKNSKLRGRNYYHQLDEARAFENALQHGWTDPQPAKSSFFSLVGQRFRAMWQSGNSKELDLGTNRKCPNYPWLPYLSYWYRGGLSGQDLNVSLPLYFPITTQVQYGNAGFSSPVQMDPKIFVESVDIIGAAEKANPGESPAMVTATNMSQLFPVMNAYTYIPGCGNFIDGGMFENQGLNLTYRLYEFVHEKLKTMPDAQRQRVQIQVIYAINSAVVPQHADHIKTDPVGQSSVILRIAAFGGIAGRTIFWQQWLKDKINATGGGFTEYVMQYPDDPPINAVPLGRWLSKRSVQFMKRKVRNYVGSMP